MMNIIRTVLAAAFAFALTAGASAATYSANGAGAIGNSSTIGPGGDYPTLAAAATDFNSVVGGMAGNYTFFISGDITETTTAAFGRPTNGFRLTFKPSPGTTPTITFTNLVDNNGPSGAWIIGSFDASGLDNNAVMTDVTIDGSNSIGGSSQDLLLTTTANFLNEFPAGTPGGGFPRVLVVWGDVDNFTLKNVRIDMPVTNQFFVATRSVYAVSITSRRNALLSLDQVPSSWTIQNCWIRSVGARQAHAIGALNSGTITAGTCQQGYQLIDNDLIGQTRGVLLNQNGAGLVARNRMRCTQLDNAGGLVSQPFIHASSNGTTGWEMVIERNVLDQIQTSATVAGGGVTGLELTGAPAAPGTTYTVVNNMISGFGWTHASPTPGDYVYAAVRSGSAQSVINLVHNSIHMTTQSVVNGVTNYRFGAVVFSSTNAVNDLYTTNNVIRVEGGPGNANSAVFVKGNNNPIDSNFNVIFQGPGVTNHAWLNAGGTVYANLAAAQAANMDLNSVNKDPLVPDAPAIGVWISPTNLRFTADPGPAYVGSVPALAGLSVPVDIDGQARTVQMRGCDEQVSQAKVGDWMIF
ncbi:MAG: hypothetical protein N2111_11485 [Candidatus Sumerlaeaceae bacterium]|nr:hypothetical protein [Candidatus Sumerlaeaceae bacterium]